MFDKGRNVGSRFGTPVPREPRGGGGGAAGRAMGGASTGNNPRGGGQQAHRVGGGGGGRAGAVVKSLADVEDEGAERMLRKGKLGEVLYRTARDDGNAEAALGQRKGPRILGWGREGGAK